MLYKKMFLAQNIAQCSPWEITKLYLNNYCFTYDNISYDLSTNGGGWEFRFNSGGTKLYTVYAGVPEYRTVFEYNLGTPWDINTLTYNQSKDFSSNLSQVIGGIDISLDGTKFVINTNGTDSRFYTYNLSTPYDITTATLNNSIIISNEDVQSIQITNGGVFLYLLNSNTNVIKQYDLQSSYDVSGLTFNKSYTIPSEINASFRGIFIRNDGLRFYVDDYQFNLTTPFDLNTMSYIGNGSGVITNSGGLHFKSDGTRYYTSSVSDENIYQYSMYGS